MRFLPALPLLLLAGCAREATVYPSLGIRPAEARGFDEPAAAPVKPVVADPALDARIGDASARLAALAKAFDAADAKAERAAGAEGATKVGSDGWLTAQTALAALDDGRAQAAGLASEVDGLARDRADADGTPYPPLDALQARADAEATRETAAVATLSDRLPSP